MTAATGAAEPSGLEVLRNRPFLLLWLSQLATQVGGNMVVYGLTIIVYDATFSSTAVSLLLLTFLAPAVLFSAVAGVYVDRIDRRIILIVTNVLRAAMFGAMFLLDDYLLAIFLLNMAVSTVTVFFAPAEAAMIPTLVPRSLLLAANSIFTFTLNAAFAIGFAALGPLVVTLSSPHALILVVAVLYLIAAGFCVTLPASPPPAAMAGRGSGFGDAERAVESMLSQLREGLDYIRANPTIGWSLVYLAIASSLVGVLGVIGPDFATESLGLSTKDFVVVVLPLGIGVVLGVFGLNSYGRFVPRRRLIEIGLVALGILVTLLSVAGPISRLLQRVESQQPVVDLSSFVSLLAVVIGIAFMAGIAYAVVAIPAQTQLQEELPEDVRGRVFGILNMLVSVASFLPIIIVGPIADWIGTTRVIVGVGVLIVVCGVASIFLRGPLRAEERAERTDLEEHPPGPVDHVAIVMTSEGYVPDSEGRRRPLVALSARPADLGGGLVVQEPPPPDPGEGGAEHPTPDPDGPVGRSASDDGSR